MHADAIVKWVVFPPPSLRLQQLLLSVSSSSSRIKYEVLYILLLVSQHLPFQRLSLGLFVLCVLAPCPAALSLLHPILLRWKSNGFGYANCYSNNRMRCLRLAAWIGNMTAFLSASGEQLPKKVLSPYGEVTQPT